MRDSTNGRNVKLRAARDAASSQDFKSLIKSSAQVFDWHAFFFLSWCHLNYSIFFFLSTKTPLEKVLSSQQQRKLKFTSISFNANFLGDVNDIFKK